MADQRNAAAPCHPMEAVTYPWPLAAALVTSATNPLPSAPPWKPPPPNLRTKHNRAVQHTTHRATR